MDAISKEPKYKNREWLFNSAVTLRITDGKIAEMIGANIKTIGKWRKKYGIPSSRESLPTVNDLLSIRCKTKDDDKKLLEKFNMTKNMLWKLREKYSIAPEYMLDIISKEHFKELYYDKKLSYSKISTDIDVPVWDLVHIAHVYGIQSRTRSEGIHISTGNSSSLSEYALDFISGEVMGDGSVVKISDYSASYYHTSKYKKYAEWLSSKFELFGIARTGNIMKRNKNGTITYSYASKAYPELLDIRKEWYPAGKKLIPKSLELTPVFMRQYYIGDGGLSSRSSRRRGINLYTCGFLKRDIDFLAGLLEDIGINTSYQKSSNILHMSPNTALLFLDYIGPCPKEIEDIYGYKWVVEK